MTPPAAPHSPPRQLQLVLWILWFGFLNGVILLRIFVAKGLPSGRADAFPWAISLLPAGLSVGVRWLLLPRARDVQRGLVGMVVGVALAEATCLSGLFLTPSRLNLLVGLSFMAVFQFAPTWADRFFPPGDEPPTSNSLPRPPR